MFAIEPPLVSSPPHVSLKPSPLNPIISASQPTTVRSTSVGPGAERHDVTFELSAEASNDANAPTGVVGEAT
jgi:hypothetical protein